MKLSINLLSHAGDLNQERNQKTEPETCWGKKKKYVMLIQSQYGAQKKFIYMELPDRNFMFKLFFFFQEGEKSVREELICLWRKHILKNKFTILLIGHVFA